MKVMLWRIGCWMRIRECPRIAQRYLIMVSWKEALWMKIQKSQMLNKFGWKRMSWSVLLSIHHLELVSHTHGILIVNGHIIWLEINLCSLHSLNLMVVRGRFLYLIFFFGCWYEYLIFGYLFFVEIWMLVDLDVRYSAIELSSFFFSWI